jgi:hypothetical protein
MLAERLDGLIHGKAGDVGSNLEQDAARLTEVDRAEVVAVLLFSRMHPVRLHELLRHGGLIGVVDSAEGNVMHRARALPARQEAAGLVDVDNAAMRRIRLEPDDRAFASGFGKAEHVGENRTGLRRLLKQQRHAVEAADRVLRRNIAIAPAGLVLRAGNADQRQAHAVRIGERQHGLAEALLQCLMRDALLDEAMGPVAQRPGGDPERGLLGLADAAATGRGILPREEGQDGAGISGLVAIIEMIGAGIVEVHRLLDEPQAQRPGVKVEVPQGVASDRGDMVDA